MGGQGGILKHLVWIAPVFLFVIWYVTQQQRTHTDDMKVEFSKFDEQFDRAWAQGPKADWEADGKEAHERYVEAKIRAKKSQEAEDETFNALEKSLSDVETAKFGETK